MGAETYRCYICDEDIIDGDKVTEFNEGYWLNECLVDKEVHYMAHTKCLYRTIAMLRGGRSNGH